MPHFSLFLDGVEIERLSLIDRVEFSFLIRKILKYKQRKQILK